MVLHLQNLLNNESYYEKVRELRWPNGKTICPNCSSNEVVKKGFHNNHKAIRKTIFFKVRRKVSWLISSTISNSTTLRARSRSIQLAYGPRRVAISLASCSPSSNFSIGGLDHFLPLSISQKPNSINLLRIISIV